MNFNEALTIVYTYAVAGRSELEEEVIDPKTERMPEEIVEEAFKMVEERVNKGIQQGVKKRKGLI